MKTWPGGTRPGRSIQPQALEIDGLGEVPGPGKIPGLQSKQACIAWCVAYFSFVE